ncbi:MAG: hypothetical protein GXX86_01770 [Propionibacterium sp.]|nr:hypothetical protein [Propionibacterium sp.]
MSQPTPASEPRVAEVGRLMEEVLQRVSEADPQGPYVAGKARGFRNRAATAPDSAWFRYDVYWCAVHAKRGAGELFTAEANQRISPVTTALRERALALRPSPERDAELAALQQAAGVSVRPEQSPAPELG